MKDIFWGGGGYGEIDKDHKPACMNQVLSIDRRGLGYNPLGIHF